MNTSAARGSRISWAVLFAVSAASLWLSVPAALAADEACSSCSQQVTLSGEFVHRKDRPSVVLEGASDAEAFREEVNGSHFTVTIAPFGVVQGRALALGETRLAGPAVELADGLVLAAPPADGEISPAALAVQCALRILTT